MPKLIFKPVLEADTDYSDVKRFWGDEVTLSDKPMRADVESFFGRAFIVVVDDPVEPERIAFPDELFVEE